MLLDLDSLVLESEGGRICHLGIKNILSWKRLKKTSSCKKDILISPFPPENRTYKLSCERCPLCTRRKNTFFNEESKPRQAIQTGLVKNNSQLPAASFYSLLFHDCLSLFFLIQKYLGFAISLALHFLTRALLSHTTYINVSMFSYSSDLCQFKTETQPKNPERVEVKSSFRYKIAPGGKTFSCDQFGGIPNDKQDFCPCWGWGKDARGLQVESMDPR